MEKTCTNVATVFEWGRIIRNLIIKELKKAELNLIFSLLLQ